MSDTARLPPLLLGLFRELLANGVPLGVRDYLDALRALQLGFGQDGRQALRDLVLALWSRSDAEHRLITGWFDLVPVPAPALVDAIDEALANVQASSADQAVGERQAGTAPAGEDLPRPASPTDQPPPDVAPVEAHARVSFVGTHAGSGLPVPRLSAQPVIDEDYVLHPHALLSLREMVVLWRRYRRSTRCGPRRELDLTATIRERCRRGRLPQPVCRARRANSARCWCSPTPAPAWTPGGPSWRRWPTRCALAGWPAPRCAISAIFRAGSSSPTST